MQVQADLQTTLYRPENSVEILSVFPDQEEPPILRPQESAAREALEEAGLLLERAATELSPPHLDEGEAARAAVGAMHQACLAVLKWHDRPLSDGASISELGQAAEPFVSMLGVYRVRMSAAQTLVNTLKGDQRLTLPQREEAVTSFYTARNVLSVVLLSLPPRVTAEAGKRLNQAQAIRLGRLRPTAGRDARA